MRVAKKKNVRDGLSVRTRDAEYPDQKPFMPFSAQIRNAVVRAEAVLGWPGACLENIQDACICVTTLDIGVVKNFEKAPAMKPKLSSSMTGRLVSEALLARTRLWRRKV